MAAGLAGCASANPSGNPGGSGDPSGSPVTTTDPMAEEPLGSPPGVACVDWVFFETPREAAADAGAVLRGTVVEQDGTEQVFGVDSNRWVFDVEEVLERPDPPRGGFEPPPELEVSAGERIAVVSTPETCSGDNLYPEGDPLDPATGRGDADGTVIVLLSGADDVEEGSASPRLITPYQGVLTPTADGTLPRKWPAP
jgi:hypothetical protein